MIITPKHPRNDKTHSRLSWLVPYMLRGKGKERCTWYMAGNLSSLDRRDDAELAVNVMELLQEGNQRAKANKTYHVVISFHPRDRQLTPAELEDVVRRTVAAAGLGEHQYIAVRHSEQEHEHVHVAVNRIHPETLKIHHPYRAIPAYQALATILEQELGLHRVDRARDHARGHRARDFEAHQGVESFSSWARRTIGDTMELDPILSWPALHEELGRFGVRLVRRGNGLAIVDATRPNLACKASALGRGWSKQRLSERYGDFVPVLDGTRDTREHVQSYEHRPLGRAQDDGLWREYQDALDAAQTHRRELREAMASRIDTARTAHRQQFKLRHHAIAAMPISSRDKRSLYKTLSFERKCAERRLRATIRSWRSVGLDTHPGSWKQFLAARTARGDRRAIRLLERTRHGLTIKATGRALGMQPPRGPRTSRGAIIHNLPGGVRIRESSGSIELLSDPRDDALEQLVKIAKERLKAGRVRLIGRRYVRRRLATFAAHHDLELSREHER